ncbi:DNA gyrase subunit A [Varibaculum massiliense]|uniref:DNA gyrase subunit A n=1 Tax=Varibaculum massiliense TaxID=1852372 RepID=UPI00288BAD9B|nr:DNA gyrase subunit A [Varibaculum massiliense]
MSEIDNQDQNQQADSPEKPQHSGAAFGGGDTASPDALENNSGLFQAKGHINQVDLETEMQRSYLDYAMSVIVGRALPEVRDGLKPVHRRILYAMYDGGYRPNAGFSKCMRVVGDVMGHFHPHGDAAVYDALARLVQPWSMRYPMVAGQGNFGSPGNLGPAAPRYTECKMAPLSMEMVRDIDEDTVDFMDNYDGRTQEPTVLPARLPYLLLNGSEGIAVGMATRIPPHNMREVADGVQWALAHPEASREELMEALIERIKGPDFPTGATILGRKGIEQAYRTGRGSIVQRAIVNVEEINSRVCLVVTELPYQVNPDNLAAKIAGLVKDGQIEGIADIRDESSDRSGQRLVIVLKRDAVPKVVLNNLYKRTQLQDSFPANMLALVDGVPRTLSIDGFISNWITHQLEVIVRRTNFRLKRAQDRLHILQGYLMALDALDAVIATIRKSPTVDEARSALMELLGVDEVQADAILALQLRRLAALERQKILDEHTELEARVKDLQDILARPERQRGIISTELGEIVDKYGDERRTKIMPFAGEMSMEDLIEEQDVVVTITHSGYVKRTRLDQYRSQKRGGKGIKGAQLREDDVVDHFFTTTTHHWLAFFTNKGRVYRAKAYELPEGGRDSKGQHVANLLAFQPEEKIAQVLAFSSYDDAEYLALATRSGLVKKTRFTEYDSNRTGGLIAINLREMPDGAADEVVSAELVNGDDELLLVSHKGQSLRFLATDEALRPTGRATSGVRGMKFREGDHLLAMTVIRPDSDLLVVTEGGYAKRTSVEEYRVQGRGGLGIKVANLVAERGGLVGALIVNDDDEVMVIMQSGKVQRSRVDEVPRTGRNTQGVIFTRPAPGDAVLAVALNNEKSDDDESSEATDEELDQEVATLETETTEL